MKKEVKTSSSIVLNTRLQTEGRRGAGDKLIGRVIVILPPLSLAFVPGHRYVYATFERDRRLWSLSLGIYETPIEGVRDVSHNLNNLGHLRVLLPKKVFGPIPCGRWHGTYEMGPEGVLVRATLPAPPKKDAFEDEPPW